MESSCCHKCASMRPELKPSWKLPPGDDELKLSIWILVCNSILSEKWISLHLRVSRYNYSVDDILRSNLINGIEFVR